MVLDQEIGLLGKTVSLLVWRPKFQSAETANCWEGKACSLWLKIDRQGDSQGNLARYWQALGLAKILSQKKKKKKK